MIKFRLLGKFIVPVLALMGLAVALQTSLSSTPKPDEPEPVASQKRLDVPFESFIAGAGIVEAFGRSVDVAPTVSGVISTVLVSVGQNVTKGEVLFELDTREARAELASKQAALNVALAQLEESATLLADAKRQYALVESVTDKRAVSQEERAKRLGQVQTYKAKSLTSLAEVESSKVAVSTAEAALTLRTVTSPLDGTILQLNAKPGQFAASTEASALVIVGRTDKLGVRLDIDENDAWRVKPGEPAVAIIRGNKDLTLMLQFDHIEPFVRPKQSLTGATNERTDTRVLQVVFSFTDPAFPVYVGQQVDAYMKVEPVASAAKSSKQLQQ
jgi:HlyD family secretion protein